MESCSICVEPLNRSTRKPVECLYCNHQSCRKCVETYLLGSSLDPHCMNCSKFWSFNFMESQFTKVFLNGDLRNHRQIVLLDREKSMLPATQEHVIKKKKEIEIKQKIKEHEEKLKYYRKLAGEENYQVFLLKREIRNIDYNVTTPKVFIRKCPLDNCKGYLNTQWNCEMCKNKICKDCNEIKSDILHICNEEVKQSIELINKDCKPCPSCATLIHKLVGCDQMFCVGCKTGFSWRTGKIETGVIHNPHYYEWVRKSNGGNIPRNPLDNPCGGLPTYRSLDSLLYNSKIPALDIHVLADIHIAVSHILNYELRRYIPTEVNNLDLRVSFLMDKLSEDEFKHSLVIREKEREKKQEFLNIYQMFVDISSDIFRKYMTEMPLSHNNKEQYTKKIIVEFISLIIYFNDTFENLGKRFNCVYPGITGKYSFVSNYKKYKAVTPEEKGFGIHVS